MSVWVRKTVSVSEYILLDTLLPIGASFLSSDKYNTAHIIRTTFPLCATQWSRIENCPVAYIPYFKISFRLCHAFLVLLP